MAKQIEGVYERILACAKKEFLQMGFAEASLRVIASEAQTTTGSIYTRFGDKQGLFEAIVGTRSLTAMNRRSRKRRCTVTAPALSTHWSITCMSILRNSS